MSAYNVPTTIRDPGVDGVLGNADDGPNIPGFNLSAAALAAPVVNTRTNLPGLSEFHTIEYARPRAARPDVVAVGVGFDSHEPRQRHGYFGNNLRPSRPSAPRTS